MQLRIALASVLVLVLAGCSSDGPAEPPSSAATPSSSASPAPTTTVSSAPSSSPTTGRTAPTAWTPEVARANFLAYVEPVNTAMSRYAALGGHPLLGPLRKSCSAIASAMAGASRKFAAGLWPTNAASKVDRLVTGLTKERAGWLACAKSNSKKLAYKATRTRYRAAALGEQVRIALGLPAVR